MKNSIPSHLKKFIVPQNYQKYSHEDQALWQFIIKGIFKNLSQKGQVSTLKSLKKKGIDSHKIPKIKTIDKNLQDIGWRAVCISGFIPPRAFMEFQKNKILSIASELRTIKHIFYTPAPDIVHEAVGHIPFLDHPVFSKFLLTYAETVLKAITSKEDMEKYKAIRDLSDIKEKPNSTSLQIKKQEQKLEKVTKNISYISESAYLSRFIWWTSEYGLIGDLNKPKVYGAGLISSIGELLHLGKIKNIRLSPRCVDYSFGITEFQPQLFVAKNFEHLLEVLEKLSQNLAFHRGGVYGVKQALASQTVNTVVLDSGLQISGILEKSFLSSRKIHFLKFKGPVQLSYKDKELRGHGVKYHNEGYSTPLALLKAVPFSVSGSAAQALKSPSVRGNSLNKQKPFFLTSQSELLRIGFKKGKRIKLQLSGGIKMEGEFVSELRRENQLLLMQFKNCLITQGKELLYHPSWGLFDLAIGSKVVSVFSGPADTKNYPLEDDFKPSKIPQKKSQKKHRYLLYNKINDLKKGDIKLVAYLFRELKKEKDNWLLFLKLLEKIKTLSIPLEPSLKKEMQKKALQKVKCQSYDPFKMGKELFDL